MFSEGLTVLLKNREQAVLLIITHRTHQTGQGYIFGEVSMELG